MLVRSRRTAALAAGGALLALATACTNPTAPSAAQRHIPTASGDGVIIGGSGAAVTPPASHMDGVIIGGSG